MARSRRSLQRTGRGRRFIDAFTALVPLVIGLFALASPSRAGDFNATLTCAPELTLDGRYLLLLPQCKVSRVYDLAQMTWADDATRDRLGGDAALRTWRLERATWPELQAGEGYLFHPQYMLDSPGRKVTAYFTLPKQPELVVGVELVERTNKVDLTGLVRIGPVALQRADLAMAGAASPHRAKKWAKAAELYRAVLALWPTHAGARYNLACVEALQGHGDVALDLLEALAKDYPSLATNIAADSDLASLRSSPRFAPLTAGASGEPIPSASLPPLGITVRAEPLTTVAVADLSAVIQRDAKGGLTYDRAALVAAVPDAFALAAHARFDIELRIARAYAVLRDVTPNGFFALVGQPLGKIFKWGDEDVEHADLGHLYERLARGDTVWFGTRGGGTFALKPR